MNQSEETFSWQWQGKSMTIGVTRCGAGPTLLILPALSTISTRHEMLALQRLLGARYATVAVDWPGFGELPRPRLRWTPDVLGAFVIALLAHYAPRYAVAAGHGAGYLLEALSREDAVASSSVEAAALLAPTWRGPLPTMANCPQTRRDRPLYRRLRRAVDAPLLGPLLYRLNVCGPMVRKMSTEHVYEDPHWLDDPQRMASKRAVLEAENARFASVRFVTGALDPFISREAFLDVASAAGIPLLALVPELAPKRSKAEMLALGTLDRVTLELLPHGRLASHEEFPAQAARCIEEWGQFSYDRPGD